MAFAGKAAFQFSLRLPDTVRDKVRAAAEKSGRSVNSEIIYLLNKALGPSAENEKSGTTA